jgi:hypothetical protein
MDKLEHYLDQVCRGIGGPRSLRQHIRQELREHLRDAAAEHKVAGLSEAEALDRALADFGGPEVVRSELEATHGRRLLPVVIEKALQWQEKTMRAKWLWATWTYLAVAGVIVLDLLFIAFAVKSQLPKLHVFTRSGWLQFDDVPAVVWLVSFLHQVEWAWDRIIWWLLIAAAAWGVFEWRVRGDNKSMMRLSACGTFALALTLLVILTAGALVLPFVIGLPSSSISRPFAVEQIHSIETSIAELEQAQARKDWEAMRRQADAATQAMTRLSSGPALHSLQGPGEPLKELWDRQYSAKESLQVMQTAIHNQDAEKLKSALEKFHKSFAKLQAAANRPAPPQQ